MTETKLTIFKQLRVLDIWKHVEKKNGFNYLSWAWALDQMYMFDDDAEFFYPPREKFDDGTVMIYCDVTIKGKTKQGFLPAMDYKNMPIKNPNARQISDNMQRCLVKAIALHGLGLCLYAGEDIPQKKPANAKKQSDNNIANATGNSMARDLDRDTQETMRDTAVTFMSKCAKLKALDDYTNKHGKSWRRSLDTDLVDAILEAHAKYKKEILASDNK